MKKLWMLLAGAAVVMSACSDDNTENAVPVPDDSLTTLSEISAVLPESRTYLDDHEFEPKYNYLFIISHVLQFPIKALHTTTRETAWTSYYPTISPDTFEPCCSDIP